MTKFVCFSMNLAKPGEKSLKAAWGPQMANPRFTDGGTLHALCLIFPLLHALEKVQKRSGSRLQKFSVRNPCPKP